MGWLISHDFTKEQQIAELVAGWEKDGRGCRYLAHSVRGNVLYAVAQPFDNGTERIEDRWILVCLLRKDRGFGWGYKDMSEADGPYVYDCPLKYLAMVPTVASESWRNGVRAWHEKRRKRSQQTIAPDVRFRFARGYKSAGASLDDQEGKILRKSGRGYIAQIGYATIKVMRRHIGEILESAGCPACEGGFPLELDRAPCCGRER